MQYIKLYLIKLLYLTCALDIDRNMRNYIPAQWYNRDLCIIKTSKLMTISVRTEKFSMIMDSNHIQVIIYGHKLGWTVSLGKANVRYDFEKDYSKRKGVSWYRFYLQKQISKIGREFWEKLCADKGVEYGPNMYYAPRIFEDS